MRRLILYALSGLPSTFDTPEKAIQVEKYNNRIIMFSF